MELWSDEQERPLQHIRVIDMTVMLPGPFVTRVLAQYGADVIKIEHLPGGDPLRAVADTQIFELLNQGKRSVALDLHSTEGVEIVRKLAGESDVFIENFRESVMDRYGLGYSHLSEENPDILYASLRGIRAEATAPAHDINFIAASGVGEWFLENGSPNLSTHFGDLIGGALVPLSKLLLHIANPARQGMHLVTYFDEGFRTVYLPRAWDSLRKEGKPVGSSVGLLESLSGRMPHSRYYRCRDGQWVALNAIQPKHWAVFCETIERPQWISRMSDVSLTVELEHLFLDAPASYWEVLTKGQHACLVRVVPWSEHVSVSMVRAQMDSDPLTWAGFAPAPQLRPCPALGRDTFAVLHGAGLSNKDIVELIQKGGAQGNPS